MQEETPRQQEACGGLRQLQVAASSLLRLPAVTELSDDYVDILIDV
jgi:hypothetical protein